MSRQIPIPKRSDIHEPEDLDGVANGDVANIPLGPCGVFSFYKPHGELEMHHLAADAMRAMVRELCDDVGLDRIEADNTTRTLARQIQMFDGTLPVNRTGTEGRYIPEALWATMPPGSLDTKPKNEREWPKGKSWRRRQETTEAAAPGTSNHGLGLAIDIVITEAIFDWLVDNASRFGFAGELLSEKHHWRYIAGDDIPLAVTQGRHREQLEPPPPPPPPIVEEDDMKIIDLASGTPAFTRLIIAGRLKWVRGSAAAALDRLDIERSDVSRDELAALMLTFGTEGTSPFSVTREPKAADPDLDQAWRDNLA